MGGRREGGGGGEAEEEETTPPPPPPPAPLLFLVGQKRGQSCVSLFLLFSPSPVFVMMFPPPLLPYITRIAVNILYCAIARDDTVTAQCYNKCIGLVCRIL